MSAGEEGVAGLDRERDRATLAIERAIPHGIISADTNRRCTELHTVDSLASSRLRQAACLSGACHTTERGAASPFVPGAGRYFMRRFLSSCRTTLDRSSWDRISFCRGDRAGAAILRPAACARASRAGLARRPHGLDGGITTGVGGAAGLFRRIPRRLRHFAPFLLFEPELLEGLTPTFACFPRILSGVPALLGVVPGGFGGQTLVLGAPAQVLGLLASILGWRAIGHRVAVVVRGHG
jgi:hypothetical protein